MPLKLTLYHLPTLLQGKNLGKCATMMNELTEAGGSDCDEVPSDPS